MNVVTQKIFLDFSNVYVPEELHDMAIGLFRSAIQKVVNAFIGTNVEIVLERPVAGEYSTLDITNISHEATDYLGIAEFDQNFNPSDSGVIRLDNIMDFASNNFLLEEQASNLMANTITHEIGHLAGLDHSNNQFDIMHDGVTRDMIDNPPSFNVEQIQAINTNAIIANLDDYINTTHDITNELNNIDYNSTGFIELDDLDLDNPDLGDSDLDIDSVI